MSRNYPLSDETLAVLDALVEHDPHFETADTLAETAGVTERRVYSALGILRRRGLIEIERVATDTRKYKGYRLVEGVRGELSSS